MAEEKKEKTFNEKIIAVMNEVAYLKKDSKVAYGNTNYNYLSEEKITSHIRGAMIKQGLIMFPTNTVVLDDDAYFEKVLVTYRITDGKESIFPQVPGKGQDRGDKSIYKAMTGAFKYAQRQTFMISTGDDPDKEASDKTNKEVVTADAKGKADIIFDIEAHAKTTLGMTGEDFKNKFGVGNMNALTVTALKDLLERVKKEEPHLDGNNRYSVKLDKFESAMVQQDGETVKQLLIRQIAWLNDAVGAKAEYNAEMSQAELDPIRLELYKKYLSE